MHTGGLGDYLALIALSHTSLALANQAIPVGHAAIVLSQWLHLMARLALLHNTKGSCMHMGLTFIPKGPIYIGQKSWARLDN